MLCWLPELNSDDRVKKLAVSLHSLLHLEHLVISQLSELKSGIKALANTVARTVDYEETARAARGLLHRMRRRFEAVESVFAHQLHRGLLASKQLEEIFADLTVRVSQAGYEFVVDGADQMFQGKISYSIDKDMLMIFIHVDIFPGGGDFQLGLFQHVPLPIRRNGSIVTVISKATHLAVGSKGESFIELSAADLLGCARDGHDWACSTVFPRLRGGVGSCLTSLYLQESEALEQRCTTLTVDEEDRWFPVNSTAFLAVSVVARTTQITCGGVKSAVTTTGITLVGMERGCVATSDRFRFVAVEENLPSVLHVVVRVPSMKQTEPLGKLILSTTKNFTSSKSFKADIIDLEDKVEDEIDAIPGHSEHWGVMDFFLLFAAIGIPALFVYCCRHGGWKLVKAAFRLMSASPSPGSVPTGAATAAPPTTWDTSSESMELQTVPRLRPGTPALRSHTEAMFGDQEPPSAIRDQREPRMIGGIRRRSGDVRLDESYAPPRTMVREHMMVQARRPSFVPMLLVDPGDEIVIPFTKEE